MQFVFNHIRTALNTARKMDKIFSSVDDAIRFADDLAYTDNVVISYSIICILDENGDECCFVERRGMVSEPRDSELWYESYEDYEE